MNFKDGKQEQFNGCSYRSWSGVDDGIDVATSIAGGVARGVQFSVKVLVGRREACTAGSIAKGFSGDVVKAVLVTAGHVLACPAVTITTLTTSPLKPSAPGTPRLHMRLHVKAWMASLP
jgi:hypothetical protein